jgi:hypothetical protein
LNGMESSSSSSPFGSMAFSSCSNPCRVFFFFSI